MIESQKILAMILLKELGEWFKTTEIYLAGGMPRDWFFSREGADYDIYLEVPAGVDNDFLTPMIHGFPLFEKCFIQEETPQGDGYDSTALHSVFTIEGFVRGHAAKVQLCFIKNNTMPVSNYVHKAFACNLSRAKMDIYGNISYDPSFVKGVLNMELDFDFAYSDSINEDYVEKIQNKFPDFELSEMTKKRFRRWWSFNQKRHN